VLRGEQCSWAKLRPDHVREIKARLARGEYQDDIAADYNISTSLVSQIKRGTTWRAIEGDTGPVKRNRKRLTLNQVRLVRDLSRLGMRQCDIARQLDISPPKVSMILSGKTWRNIPM
jgi:transcriptional regulator with XRE-family HTH domain